MAETPGSFWMTPHDIYVKLTTGPGSDTLDVVQQSVHAIWQAEEKRATLIRQQAVLLENAWQGAAGDGAYGAALPLAESALSGAEQLSQAQDLMDRQSGSFNRAKNDVVPVPPEPPKLDPFDVRVVFTDYEKDLTAYQANAQHNIDVFSNYDGASDYNETRMPANYATSDHSGGTINVVPEGGRRGDTGDFIEVADYEPPRGEPRSSGEPGQVSGPPVSGPVPDSQRPTQTTPNDFRPVTPSGGPLPTPSQPGSSGSGSGWVVPGLPVGGFTGSRPGGSTGGPGPRAGTYGGGPGTGGPGTGGPGASGRGPGVGMRGGMLGAGPGALAAEEAAAQRAAAAAAARGGGSGMVGGAPVGAGRGKGDEDEEHKRKVLIEADAEGVFGSDVLTAPEVIGDDEYEDD